MGTRRNDGRPMLVGSRARRLKPGNTLGLRAPSGKQAFVVVMRVDPFGVLLRLTDSPEVAPGGTCREAFAYVNPASIRAWTLGEHDVHVDHLTIPPIFHGSSTVWTVQAGDEVVHIPGTQASMADLTRRGYVHKVLWLGKNIEAWFDGHALEWPFPL